MNPLVGLTVLIDDVRSFRDGRACRVARSSAEGVRLMTELREEHIDHLWLDHDLVGDDTIWPVIHLIESAALESRPFQLGMVHVHASRSGPAHQIVVSMRRAGYQTKRHVAGGVFTW